MKKYSSLAELLIDHRARHNLSQSGLAALLDMDARTIRRWESGESRVKSGVEKELAEKLFIPYQVVHNLNSDHPIAVYYDFNTRVYSLSAIMKKATGASWYKSELPVEDDSIRLLSNDSDVEFVADIQQMNKNLKPIQPGLIKLATHLLPELNLVLLDQSGFYAGHTTVLPLKYNAYLKLRNREINENQLSPADISSGFTEKPLVFYYYSLYADSVANSYYLMNRLLSYFKEHQFKDYLFAGITYRKYKLEIFREMGLKIIWQDDPRQGEVLSATFLEGNLDMFLFGKMI